MSASTPLRVPLAAAASLLVAAMLGPAAWAATDLEPAFTGTVISTYPDGRTAKLWLNSDGSWRGVSRRGRALSGRWSVKGGRLCLKQLRPFPAPFAHCALIPPEGSTTWTDKAATGEQIRLELVPGR